MVLPESWQTKRSKTVAELRANVTSDGIESIQKIKPYYGSYRFNSI